MLGGLAGTTLCWGKRYYPQDGAVTRIRRLRSCTTLVRVFFLNQKAQQNVWISEKIKSLAQ